MGFTNVKVPVRLKPSTKTTDIPTAKPTKAYTNVGPNIKVEPSDLMDDPAPPKPVGCLVPAESECPPHPMKRGHNGAVTVDTRNPSGTDCDPDSVPLKEEAPNSTVKTEPLPSPSPLKLPEFVKSADPAAASELAEVSGVVEEDPPHEFIEAYRSLTDATLVGLPDMKAPRTPSDFNTFRFDNKYQAYPHRQVIGIYVSHLSRYKRELPPGGHQAVANMLRSLFKIEGVTPQIDNDYKYTWILKTIMGESDLARTPYAFPTILAEQASIVLDHFQDDLNIGIDIDSSPTPLPTPVIATSSTKKVNDKPTSIKSSSKKRKASEISTSASIQYKPFDMENPQIAGMMHNMLRGPRGGPKIKDSTLKLDYNKFGHNGLEVGHWWPYQACALRDGAHGSSMGGIAGGARDGAKSIVVGGKFSPFLRTGSYTNHEIGGYEGMDKDEGHIIYYSGSNSHENEDRDTPHISNATKSLQRAMLDNRNIRVLRSAKGDSRFAPCVGIRYDGLYKIVAEEKKFNAKGGAYLRFRLVRQGGQVDIDLTRPDQRERQAFAILKQSV
jgi:hypothetical protein